jgi:predicted amidohydrolase YtcJ
MRPDIPSLVAQLRRWAEEHPDAAWIVGSFYDQNRLAERRHPTRHDLDQVSLEKPVFIEHTSKHGGVANSVALRIAGITRETPTRPAAPSSATRTASQRVSYWRELPIW